eukprot:scaffold13163_cov98-Isochrysis_galbana.AAC.2
MEHVVHVLYARVRAPLSLYPLCGCCALCVQEQEMEKWNVNRRYCPVTRAPGHSVKWRRRPRGGRSHRPPGYSVWCTERYCRTSLCRGNIARRGHAGPGRCPGSRRPAGVQGWRRASCRAAPARSRPMTAAGTAWAPTQMLRAPCTAATAAAWCLRGPTPPRLSAQPQHPPRIEVVAGAVADGQRARRSEQFVHPGRGMRRPVGCFWASGGSQPGGRRRHAGRARGRRITGGGWRWVDLILNRGDWLVHGGAPAAPRG